MAGSDGRSEASAAGYFISFEGGDGVGKSTQIKLLAEKLRETGRDVVVSREPGGTPGAEAVRYVVLDSSGAEPFGPYLEAILFAAARNDHVEQLIRPALQRGSVVLVDRFMDSTRVYQGESENLGVDFVSALERVAVAGVIPDLTIILDIDVTEGLRRAHARRDDEVPVDRFEKEEASAHVVRRAAFLKIARQEPERCKVVDASGTPEEVAARVWKLVGPRFAPKKRGRAGKAGNPANERFVGAVDDAQ